jgi:diguanylate cyclase (GGDEF)-like protein
MSTQAVSDTDALTGLPNYDAFLTDLSPEIQRAERDSGCLSLALFDLDWFTRINREQGQAFGDAVLQALGRHLSIAFDGKGKVYRFGGDALAVLLPGLSKEQAFLLAEDARREFDRAHDVTVDDRTVSVPLSVSAGLAAYPDDGVKDAEVVRKANEAVYRAKVTGRNRVCLAREEKMVTKTSHYTQGQLEGLSRLAKREGLNESVLLREALDDLLRKYNR